MIQANDLRLGNRFIRELRTPRGIEYDHDFVLTEEMMGKLFGDNIEIALQDLFPIPLTHEILEKARFKYLKVEGISRISDEFDEPDEGDTHNWTLRINQSSYCDSFRFELVKWGDQLYFTFSNQWLRIRIKYLHQLQNLYFALTGEELEIKL